MCDDSSFVLAHDCFGYSGLLWFHMNFRVFFPLFLWNFHCNFDSDCIKSVDCFGSYRCLNITLQSMNTSHLSFYLCLFWFILSLLYSSQWTYFSCLLVTLILKYFILWIKFILNSIRILLQCLLVALVSLLCKMIYLKYL